MADGERPNANGSRGRNDFWIQTNDEEDAFLAFAEGRPLMGACGQKGQQEEDEEEE